MAKLRVGMAVRFNSTFAKTIDYKEDLRFRVGTIVDIDDKLDGIRVKLHFDEWKGGHGPSESYWWVYGKCLDILPKEVEYPEDGTWV